MVAKLFASLLAAGMAMESPLDRARRKGMEDAAAAAIKRGADPEKVRVRLAAMKEGKQLPSEPTSKQYALKPIDDDGIARMNAARAKRAAIRRKRAEAYDKGEAGKRRG